MFLCHLDGKIHHPGAVPRSYWSTLGAEIWGKLYFFFPMKVTNKCSLSVVNMKEKKFLKQNSLDITMTFYHTCIEWQLVVVFTRSDIKKQKKKNRFLLLNNETNHSIRPSPSPSLALFVRHLNEVSPVKHCDQRARNKGKCSLFQLIDTLQNFLSNWKLSCKFMIFSKCASWDWRRKKKSMDNNSISVHKRI